MTEMLQRELSRTQFLKGGGALIVGFGLAGATGAGRAEAANPYVSRPLDHDQIDTWIAIHADNTASIKSGSIFQGTGSTTGILMIAAEELDMDLRQVRHVRSDTAVTPATGAKSASNTITGGAGRGVRAAAAHARGALLELASKRLGVPVSKLSVRRGVVSGGGKSVTYGQLVGGKLINVKLPAKYDLEESGGFGFAGGLAPGQAPAKPVSSYKVVGTSPPRIDIPGIVTGTDGYVQNVFVRGMLHGRIVRPRGQAVYGFGAPIVSVDERSIRHIKGARVVRKKDFLGVVAPNEYDAIQAAAQLKVRWKTPPKALAGHGNELRHMRELDKAGKTVASDEDYKHVNPNKGGVDRALASAAHVYSGSFGWPGNVHTPMGAGCVLADVTSRGARIFAGTQGVYTTRAAVAEALGVPEAKVRVTAYPMGGAFGSSQYDDAAVAAALMSQLAGAPVRVQFMRWDEIGWGNTGPGMLADVRAGVDEKGNLVAFDFTQYYPEYKEGGETSAELAGKTKPASAMSGNFWPVPMYNVPNNRYLAKIIPLEGNWVKAAWLREGSDPATVFAREQVIDELAHAAKMDPVAFRVQNVATDGVKEPLLAVMAAVTKTARWRPHVSASKLAGGDVVSGRGVAWNGDVSTTGCQTAAIADVTVNRRTGKITVKHVYEAIAGGLAVYPGGIENQIVGGVTQIVSRVLAEQFRYDRQRVTSSDFVSYPILRFKDAPKVTPIVVQRKGDVELMKFGFGEPVAVVPAAAIANAVFDATGVRLHTAPLTPARVRAALKAARK